MVEVSDLLAKMKIFEKRRPSLASFQRVLVVIDSEALICREVFLRSVLLEHREIFVLVIFSTITFSHVRCPPFLMQTI